jgi:hypothetical protein
MLHKTLVAILVGCLLSISIMLNLNYLLPLNIDQKLIIGLLVAFPMWAIAMVMSYSSESAKQAWKRCGYPLVVSAFINVFYFMG